MKLAVLFTLSLLFALQTALGDSPPVPAARQFDIGAIIPLSGDLAEYGIAIRNGFEMAQNENAGKFSNLRFVYEDSKYDGKSAVTALQKLRNSGSVDLYYLWGVSPTEAMLPIAHSQKLAVVAETTVKEATVGKPFVIRAARTGERIAQALAREIVQKKVKSVSFITAEIPFYVDIQKHLVAILESKGVAIDERQEVLPAQTDFKSFLLNRKVRADELVGVLLLPAQYVSFFRQAAELKVPIAAFSADILDSDSIVNACPSNVDGTFYTQVGVTPEFRSRYKTRYGSDIQIGSAAQAFDLAILLADLFGATEKKLSSVEVIDILSKMPPRTGATGKFAFSNTADSGKEIRMPVSMKIVRDKKLETLTEDTGF